MAVRALSQPQLPDLDFEAMTAEELISWTHQHFWPRVCLTCSWQKQSSVLVHMEGERPVVACGEGGLLLEEIETSAVGLAVGSRLG